MPLIMNSSTSCFRETGVDQPKFWRCPIAVVSAGTKDRNYQLYLTIDGQR